MSDTERLQLRGRSKLPDFGSRGLSAKRERPALGPIGEHLLLFGIFASCAAFWLAVIVWLAD